MELLDSQAATARPTSRRSYDGSGHELCRVVDLNHDGKPDLYEYFDASGAVRRREADYDENGVIDSVEFYEGGALVKREYDTTGQHRVDTWDYFDKTTGKRVRRERDTTNDGRVYQWWTWNGDKITIAIDKDGDGKPDAGHDARSRRYKTGDANDRRPAAVRQAPRHRPRRAPTAASAQLPPVRAPGPERRRPLRRRPRLSLPRLRARTTRGLPSEPA